ncbi:hypothetical protein PIB30_097913 [Stylosanthes scabra]|uniref:Uncharacterized protein n=1 Tax=Stylosanthes scabra TaxID=79078 RepID=A0ABU6XT72_9FABA|nr:hypothetical protein [Stylosanthes scabra]
MGMKDRVACLLPIEKMRKTEEDCGSGLESGFPTPDEASGFADGSGCLVATARLESVSSVSDPSSSTMVEEDDDEGYWVNGDGGGAAP